MGFGTYNFRNGDKRRYLKRYRKIRRYFNRIEFINNFWGILTIEIIEK
jgi:hypothetical protein